MRKIFTAALLASAMVASAPSSAKMDGNQLYDIALAAKKSPGGWEDGYYGGFVNGVLTSTTVAMCIPGDVRIQQLWDIVFNYMVNRPESRQSEATDIVAGAVMEAYPYPCRQ